MSGFRVEGDRDVLVDTGDGFYIARAKGKTTTKSK